MAYQRRLRNAAQIAADMTRPYQHGVPEFIKRMCKSKIRYASESAAQPAVDSLAMRFEIARSYECPHCNGFHVSTKPKITA